MNVLLGPKSGTHEAGVSRRIMRSGGVERGGLEKMKGADPERDPRMQLSPRKLVISDL